VAAGREHAYWGKASHRGHRGHRGGLGLAGEPKLVDNCGCRREHGKSWKASHRGHRGGLGLVDEPKLVDNRGCWREHGNRGKHRTEVTEGDRGWPANCQEKSCPLNFCGELNSLVSSSITCTFCARFTQPRRRVSTLKASATISIPLCGLCDLCAMLSSDLCRSRSLAPMVHQRSFILRVDLKEIVWRSSVRV
jgi:hypothetical protein